MKIKLLAILFFIGLVSKAQDLVVASGTVSSNTLYTSDLLDVSFQIKNTGSAISMQSHAGIYLANNKNATGLIPIGYVSVEQLAPNQVSNTNYKLPFPYHIPSGTYYLYVVTDHFNVINETNENNIFYLQAPITINQNHWLHTRQNLPYPILFVHGWTGDGTTWMDLADSVLNKQYGWSGGGVLDFCLNYDNNTSTGELYNDFHDYTNDANLKPADYYFINFDIDYDGNWWDYEGKPNDVCESNQSAIRKQGYGIKKSIEHILHVTGRDKVILAAHSMGGLACREYLARWAQNDGQHHVAKLLTVGTPNQGSDATLWGLGLNGNEKSEAVRDLRRSYSISGDDGVYLFGGTETYSSINNNIAFNYHNVDVNCNSLNNTGELISGLNYQPFEDINYACIMGTGDGGACPGMGSSASDGIVEEWSANLYNAFLSTSPSYIDTFVVKPLQNYSCFSGDFLHLYLPKSDYGNYTMMALDEPDFFDETGYGHAYAVDFNKLYFGTITQKNKDPFNAGNMDYDDYKFTLTAPAALSFNLYDINIPDLEVQLYNSSQQAYSSTVSNNGKGSLSFSMPTMPAGTYYLELRGRATMPATWTQSYGFEIKNTTIATDVAEENIPQLHMNCFPNPSTGIFNVQLFSSQDQTCNLEIYNSMGEKIISYANVPKEPILKIDLSTYANGIYIVKSYSQSGKSMSKNIILNK